MKAQRYLVYGCFILLAGSVSGCAGPERMLVVGAYYTALTEDGDPRLYFDDPHLGPVELGAPSVVGIAKSYVASYESETNCSLFPVDAATAKAARSGQIGPLTEATCKEKVFELTGDSLRLRSLIDF